MINSLVPWAATRARIRPLVMAEMVPLATAELGQARTSTVF
jgi:hypothetical protein